VYEAWLPRTVRLCEYAMEGGGGAWGLAVEVRGKVGAQAGARAVAAERPIRPARHPRLCQQHPVHGGGRDGARRRPHVAAGGLAPGGSRQRGGRDSPSVRLSVAAARRGSGEADGVHALRGAYGGGGDFHFWGYHERFGFIWFVIQTLAAAAERGSTGVACRRRHSSLCADAGAPSQLQRKRNRRERRRYTRTTGVVPFNPRRAEMGSLFYPFRALGYITEGIPFATQRRGGARMGTSVQLYTIADRRLEE